VWLKLRSRNLRPAIATLYRSHAQEAATIRLESVPTSSHGTFSEVEATDENSGIEKAVEEFLLSSEQTKRLIVQRMSMRGAI
jgi:hypothetical protein